MALSARLEMRQGQQLVMTPQLQQAIRLLQLSNMELNAFVEQEVERNPLLERDENGEAPLPTTIDSALESDAGATAANDYTALDLAKPDADAVGALDTSAENLYPDAGRGDIGPDLGGSNWTNVSNGSSSYGDDEYNPENFVAADISLKDHLLEQMQIALQAPAERLIGQYLIDQVDDAGYLTAALEEIAVRLGCSIDLVERVLAKLQTFDPPGVMARGLAECLALQLKDQNRFDPQIAALLDNLDLLGSHNITALKRAVGVEMDELSDMIAELKHLNPKPGLAFGSVHVQPVVPDVLVRPASDGSWFVELNNDTLPRVLVNRSYYTRVSRTARSPQDKDYIVECLQSANWLAKSLDQRARTILRVAEEIVRQQDGFFAHGVQHLRPLNLKTVADAIKMHESTVSRVTSNKYIATPRGIFELKYFFTSSIASSGEGEAHSSEAVRHRIKQLIDGETAQGVLSDDKLVERLKDDGIDIARRTVAKYREAMRIPSSVQRRREKRMDAQMERAE
ncbi:MAG: RNA polymerase factor sigma-54 [Hyphomicrobiaceae bacterium]